MTLCVAGLRALSPRAARRFVAPAGVALFALFDCYTLHMVALPYYTGMTAHRPGGPVSSFHPAAANWGEFLTRLAAFKSPLLSPSGLTALWVCYAAATLGLVALSLAARWRTGGADPRSARVPPDPLFAGRGGLPSANSTPSPLGPRPVFQLS